MPYDPRKAHAYYERTKHLKGRSKGPPPPKLGVGSRVVDSNNPNSSRHPPHHAPPTEAIARVNRLKSAVSKLESALSEARAALVQARAKAAKTARENSDGKSTAKEKRDSKEFRDKHKQEISTKQKEQRKAAGSKSKSGSSSGGSSSSTSSSSSSSTSSVSTMSVTELQARIIKINSALSSAKSQLSTAQQSLGRLAHSAITSEPTFDEHFARFRSAERRPST